MNPPRIAISFQILVTQTKWSDTSEFSRIRVTSALI